MDNVLMERQNYSILRISVKAENEQCSNKEIELYSILWISRLKMDNVLIGRQNYSVLRFRRLL